MSQTGERKLVVVDAPEARCWGEIGVWGDRSCERLAEMHHCHRCGVFADTARAFLDRPLPPGYGLDEAARVRKGAESRRRAEASILVFELGGESLCVDTANVAEAVEPRPIRRVPRRSNTVFRGLVNIRGQLELCVSLHGLLGTTSSSSVASTRRMLVLAADNVRWVIEVDAISGTRRLQKAAFGAPPSTLGTGATSFIDHVIRDENETIGHIAIAPLFAALDGHVR